MDCQTADVDCCETDGCNDGTSAGDQSRAISMVALILLALAVRDTFY